ncbi:hypothetical protein ROR02_28910 [Pararhodospirillum oryzae]|uniref:Uncharacterized protein n=1 Tax=Pararhodospirillum oryzae TaxID=478448 RepID=A0A512HBI9_9PROT|nr:hypothetical protein ROR02_28910 [Pararhodospirillum oryzae]
MLGLGPALRSASLDPNKWEKTARPPTIRISNKVFIACHAVLNREGEGQPGRPCDKGRPSGAGHRVKAVTKSINP